ncbi:MAG: CPBP family intramembrane metalloprotease [Verrucomicrobiota bacterium]
MAIYLVVQTLVFLVFMFILSAKGDVDVDVEELAESGLFFGIASSVSAVISTLLVIGCVALKKGVRIVDYLKLYRPRLRSIVIWTVLFFVIFTPIDWLRIEVFEKPVVPEFMLDAYLSCDFLPILWFAILIGAPFAEEFLFRGFVFEGIKHTRMGSVGAVVICSLVWSAVHLQYDLIDMSVVFLGGLFLGVAKLRTGTLWVPIILHFIWNLGAMIQTAMAAAQV